MLGTLGVGNLAGAVGGAVGGAGNPGLNGTIDPEWASKNPDKAQAAVSDAQWADFEARYRPIEEAAIAEFLKSPDEAAGRAGLAAAGARKNDATATARQLSRYGANMTADQQKVAARQQGLSAARGVAGAENITRRNIRDRNIDGMGTMIGIGKGVAGGAQRDLSSAAGMQQDRINAGKAAKAAHRQSTISTATSALGMAAMLMF